VASAPGAAAIVASDEQDTGDSGDAPTTGSSRVDSTSDGPTHGAAHRGRSAGGLSASATDLLSSLALLQGSVAAMTAQAQTLQVEASPGGMAEGTDAQDADDDDTLQTIDGVSTANGSNDVDATAGGASGAAQGTDGLSNFASWLTTNAVPAGAEVIAGAGTGTGASAGGTADAKGRDSLASVAARAASLLPQLLAAIPTSSDSTAVSRLINVPVSDPSWPQALAAQVQWMLGSQVQSATLRLSPAHLGPIQIRIDLQQSQINVSFSATHADTRSALAEAIPRLREMLASGGLTLGQANVQQDAPGGGHAQSQGASAGGSGADAGETVEPVALAQRWALGLVDEYV
jgi:flagellar hook-length control protein FliK